MKTRKKLLIALLSATCLTAGAFGITACSKNSETNDKALVGIYNSYVDEANGKNEEPLSYEAWLKKVFGTVGQKGEDGEDGKDGKSAYEIYRDAEYKANRTPLSETAWLASLVGTAGVSPSIGENGNWYLGTSDTGVKAAGVDGVGVTSVTLSQDGKSLVVTFTSGDPVSVPLPDQITHKHTYGNEYTVVIPSTGETEGIGYKVCTGDGCEHIELVTIASYSYKISVLMSDAVSAENGTPVVAANAKVTLKNDKGETVAEATTDDNGEAIFEGIEKGEYLIVVEKEGYISYAEIDKNFAENMGTTSKNASDYYAVLLTLPSKGTGVEGKPYSISVNADLNSEMFYVELPLIEWEDSYVPDATFITFTASKAGLYHFTNSGDIDMYDAETSATLGGYGDYAVALNEGDVLAFMLPTGNGDYDDLTSVILNVNYKKLELGSQEMPVSVKHTDDVTFSAKADDEVWFCLAHKFGDKVRTKITFDEDNLTVADVEGNTLSSGDIIVIYEYADNYYFTVSAKDGNISFKTEAYYVDGEKSKPIALEGAGEYEFTADPNATYGTDIWYKLDVAADTTYLFAQTNGSLHFAVYSDLNSDEADFESSDATFGYEFKAGTYYINVSSYNDDTFEIKAFNPETDTGLVPSYPITAGADNTPADGLRYYKYTAANAGYVVISSSGYINLIVYKDATYNEVDFYIYQNKPIAVAAGDSVYFTCYGSVGDNFNIENIASDAQVAYTVAVTDTATGNTVQGIKVKLMDGENVAGEATTDADGVATLNLAAGSYSVVVELTDEQKELYVLSTNSDDGVSLVNKNADVALISYVDYEVTVEGLDLLDDAEGVTVVFYYGEYGWMDINWYEISTSDIADGKATFKNAPTKQFYKFALAGLPEGFEAEEVIVANGTASYTLTVTEATGGDEDNGDLGTLGIGEKEFNVTERKTYTFTASSNTGEIYISVTGGYIEYLKSNNEVCINDGNEDSTSYSNDYTFGSEKYILIIVPTDEENGATVTIETVSY